jgi:hypothetical protein
MTRGPLAGRAPTAERAPAVADDRLVEELREAIDAVAERRVPGLIDEARAEAEVRARARLAAAFEAALLDRASRELHDEVPPRTVQPRRAEPEPAEPEPPTAEPAIAEPVATEPVATEPATSPPSPEPRSDELGYYVYGVARAREAEIPHDLEGVDPRHSIRLISHRDLVALASSVSLSEFGEEPLHENLNDVEWLEAKARAHEQVLDRVLSQMPVVPMRLCTIYRSEGHLREVLEREHDVFADALERLEGKTEWGVKVIAEPGALDRAADEAAGNKGSSDASLSAGAAYMREKSRDARRREAADRIAERWAQEVHDRAAAHAVEALLNPLQNPEVSGHTGDMLLNGVYLVDDRNAGEFHSAVDALATEFAAHGAGVQLTGPWPPYNFVKGSIEAAR